MYASMVCHWKVQDIPKVFGDIHHKKAAMAATNSAIIAPSREMTFILKAPLLIDDESDGITEGCGTVLVSGISVAGGLGGGRGLGRAIIVAAETDRVIGSSETEAKWVTVGLSSGAVNVPSRSAVIESPVESVEGLLETMDSGTSSGNAVVFAFGIELASNAFKESGSRPRSDFISGEAGDSLPKETVSGNISGSLSRRAWRSS